MAGNITRDKTVYVCVGHLRRLRSLTIAVIQVEPQGRPGKVSRYGAISHRCDRVRGALSYFWHDERLFGLRRAHAEWALVYWGGSSPGLMAYIQARVLFMQMKFVQ